MANNFDSNFTRKLMREFIPAFESQRVISKEVNTQLFNGAFNPAAGDTVDIKRPTDYISRRTPDGDISATTASSIVTGKASAVVQNYITVEVDYKEADEAIKADQLEELLKPAAMRLVTDLETDFAGFAMKNSGLLAGSPGTAVTTWDQVAEAGSVMESTGVPKDGMWKYFMNPYTQRSLASDQRSLGGETGQMTANQMAVVTNNFAGMKVMTATTLDNYVTPSTADRAGTLSANPDVTYVTAKDSMTQSLAVTGFGANLAVKAGDVIKITGRNRLNLSTRKAYIDETGANVEFTATVTADVTLDGSGAGTLVVTGPAIFEADGQYNTVDSAPVSGDVVTLLGAPSSIIQPNLFFHRDAFAIASVPIEKLHSTDTVATTADGLQIRVSKGSSIRENKQIVRFDLRPAYGVMNPFFAGHSHG
jgi:P22 coat protein - gene protein 5.